MAAATRSPMLARNACARRSRTSVRSRWLIRPSRAASVMLKAILWDVDGTLAETERDGHRVAFNQAFEALGLPWRWSERRYGELLRVSGGRERLLHDMASRSDAPVLAA